MAAPESQLASAPYVQGPPPAYYQPPPQFSYTVLHNVQPATNVTIVRTPPDNHLVFAILVTIFCCLPFGIVAIVKSVDSTDKFNRGDDVGAANSANLAKSWSIAGLVCGIVLISVPLLLLFIILLSY